MEQGGTCALFMWKLLLVVLGIVFIYSYIKFKRQYKLSLMLVSFMENKCLQVVNDIDALLSLCSVYTEAQLYKRAYDKYNEILKTPELKELLSRDKLDRIAINMRFCDAPLFWSSGAKDHFAFRYLHHFLLRRIGRQRFVFTREEDLLEFNSAIRRLHGQ